MQALTYRFWEMDKILGKWLKYMGLGLNIWGTVYLFEVRRRYVTNDLSI